MLQKNGNKPKNRYRAFTLMEAIIALLVIAMTLLTLQWIRPSGHNQNNEAMDVALSSVVHQMQSQQYRLIGCTNNQVRLKNRDGKFLTLLVEHHTLKMVGDTAGQIILINHVEKLSIADYSGYLLVTIQPIKGNTASDMLILIKDEK